MHALPDCYYVGAAGVDAAGLPFYPPVVTTNWTLQAHIWRDGEPFFLCQFGSHYKTYLHFPPTMLACDATTSWNCERCRDIMPSTAYESRNRVIGTDGAVKLLCRMCGKYLRPGRFNPSGIRIQPSACSICHARRVAAGVLRNASSTCSQCGTASTMPVCKWCAMGAPPITAGALFGDRAPATLQNVNAASLIFGTAFKH